MLGCSFLNRSKFAGLSLPRLTLSNTSTTMRSTEPRRRAHSPCSSLRAGLFFIAPFSRSETLETLYTGSGGQGFLVRGLSLKVAVSVDIFEEKSNPSLETNFFRSTSPSLKAADSSHLRMDPAPCSTKSSYGLDSFRKGGWTRRGVDDSPGVTLADTSAS